MEFYRKCPFYLTLFSDAVSASNVILYRTRTTMNDMQEIVGGGDVTAYFKTQI
jgi:hypothetical protein